MTQLTERERITILMMRGWGDNERSYQEVANLFNTTFRVEQAQLSKGTVTKTVQRFLETGNVKNLPKSGRPVSTGTEENQLDVALSIIEDPYNSILKLQQQQDLSYGTVQRILTKKLHFHPYKVHLVHKLNDDDPDRRLVFRVYDE